MTFATGAAVTAESAGPAPVRAAAADPHLARVLTLAQAVVPSLRGEQSDAYLADALRPGSAALHALCRRWAAAHPEAGAHYLALRCWGLAIWQPVYLSVIAVHLGDRVPRLAGIAQPVVDGFPTGFRLPVHAPVGADAAARIGLAAAELRGFCRSMQASLAPLVSLHARAADRLWAECVLGALLLVRRRCPAWRDADVAGVAAEWLARLGIEGGCGFFAYRARDGTPALALDRQVCCHHFRRRDGDKCSTCPKLPIETRIARLLADPS